MAASVFVWSNTRLASAKGIVFLRPLQSSNALEKAMRILREKVPFMDQDRWLSPDIEAAVILVNSGKLSEHLPSFHLVEQIEFIHHLNASRIWTPHTRTEHMIL